MASRPVREAIEGERGLVRAAPGDTVSAAAAAMAEGKCGSVVVMEGDRLVGIFTERDLVTRVAAPGRDLKRTRLEEVMTRDPDTIGPDEPVEDAIRKMDECGYRYLPVVDADGAVLGVVSASRLPSGTVQAMQPELDERHKLAERMW